MRLHASSCIVCIAMHHVRLSFASMLTALRVASWWSWSRAAELFAVMTVSSPLEGGVGID